MLPKWSELHFATNGRHSLLSKGQPRQGFSRYKFFKNVSTFKVRQWCQIFSTGQVFGRNISLVLKIFANESMKLQSAASVSRLKWECNEIFFHQCKKFMSKNFKTKICWRSLLEILCLHKIKGFKFVRQKVGPQQGLPQASKRKSLAITVHSFQPLTIIATLSILDVCRGPGTCAYQGVRNISFLENFANVLNE